jgi:hypothetical protein
MERNLMKNTISTLIICLVVSITFQAKAGNPDRQGEAGAYELLLNPWARSAGLHAMTTSMIEGVEAMRLNIAGLSRLNRTEVILGHTILFDGTGMALNSVGFGQRMGKSGAFGISIMTVDFGDIPVTTTEIPEGTGATFSPNFFNIGFGYSHTFENKVSVGILFRGVSETISDLSAFGFALDAGVQYVAGEQDNFKFGISLRNIGSPMRFGGEGLSFQTSNPKGDVSYNLTVDQRSETFELPSMLNLGLSYDFIIKSKHRLTVIGNFTSNSFARDQVGGGIEYALNNMFMVRGGYKYDLGSTASSAGSNIYSGISAGITIDVPIKKQSSSRFAVDYAYRATSTFDGTHNFSIRYRM